MMTSLAGQVVVEVDVDGRHIVLLGGNLQFFVHLRLVFDPVLSQGGLHVEYLPLPLPSVALGVYVYLLVAVQDLPDGLLTRHFQLVFGVAEGVDDPHPLRLLGQLADEEVLILPPWNGQWVVLGVQVQVLALGDVVLGLTLGVDEATGLLGLLVEPAGDVAACCLDERLDLGQVPVLLDEGGEVVDVVEEGHPDVVGGVVTLQFLPDVVLPVLGRLGQQLFDVVCCTFSRHYTLQDYNTTQIIKPSQLATLPEVGLETEVALVHEVHPTVGRFTLGVLHRLVHRQLQLQGYAVLLVVHHLIHV